MPCAQPKTSSAAGEPGHEPDGQQREVDRRVEEREDLELLEASRAAPPAASPSRRSVRRRPRRASAPGRPATRRARRARGRASTSAPSASQAWPISITIRLGRQTSASTVSVLGHDRPLLLELARERSDRVLADLDRAAGAERPAAGPGRDPVRAAAGEPAAVGDAHRAQHRERRRRVVADQPQRPAHRLQLEVRPPSPDSNPASRAARPSCEGEPRSCERGDRGVGRAC